MRAGTHLWACWAALWVVASIAGGTTPAHATPLDQLIPNLFGGTVNTSITPFDVTASQSLGSEQRARIVARCGPVVRAVAQDARSQARFFVRVHINAIHVVDESHQIRKRKPAHSRAT